MGKAGFKATHFQDPNGNPAGGTTFGNGFAIGWQNGPLGRHVVHEDKRKGCCLPIEQEPDCDVTELCGRPLCGCIEGCTRIPPNGAFVEDVLGAVVDRIEFYQSGKFACDRNARALVLLSWALAELNGRTQDREARKVEGTHAL